MNVQKEQWFVGQRAEQLAILMFTRKPDLIVTTNCELANHPFDLLVTIPKDGKATGRMFGVEIKARTRLKSKMVKDETYEISDPIPVHFDFNDFAFPLCIAVFDMSVDEGYYRWLLAPSFSSSGAPKLEKNVLSKEYKRLDSNALDDLISEVNQWYDRRNCLT